MATTKTANALRRREQAIRKEFGSRVDRGARLLDGVRPDWWQEIDKATLDMESGYSCIVGQVFVNGHFTVYGDAIRAIEKVVGWDGGDAEAEEDFDMAYGFNMPYVASDPDIDVGTDKAWSLLAEIWMDEVKARARKAAKSRREGA